MKLGFDTTLAEGYTSAAQRARVLTEGWVGASIFCPNCGCVGLEKSRNNTPVGDFSCQNCREEYELKSKRSPLGTKVAMPM